MDGGVIVKPVNVGGVVSVNCARSDEEQRNRRPRTDRMRLKLFFM